VITVVHIITGLNTGGAEAMLHKLVGHSDPQRFRHIVISLLDIGPVGVEIAALGIPVHSLHMRGGVPDSRAIVRLRRRLIEVNPDVIQTWLYHANLLGLLGGLVTGRPVVWNLRSSYHRGLGRTIVAIARACALLSRMPAAVVTNSDVARIRHEQLGYRPKEWLVIPNGFDVESFAPDPEARQSVRRELRLPFETTLIGLVGRFHPMKGHQTFFEAAEILSRRWPETHFILVGRGVEPSNRTLWEAIVATGLASRVHLLGERQDIPRLTAALDIATNASLYGESFSNAIGEAMASAIPCVVTDVGDMASIVGNMGRVVPPGDASALAAAWHELLVLGHAGRGELGRQARDRIKARYSLEAIVQQYEALYLRFANAQ
jgi:glycosyltransferase involved in cell wall biosynthesis